MTINSGGTLNSLIVFYKESNRILEKNSLSIFLSIYEGKMAYEMVNACEAFLLLSSNINISYVVFMLLFLQNKDE